ncbi:hypothetical protein EYF80_004105 [Liparis tanakae]|uniref:Uncharacterized protein n=1 Tax=Liparis tanakae TaxID=230148 RepID=A0A4Z2J7A5_9TELE|nr:hypothetical protein EYF80_004105 [Liparis tanakae]
MMGFDPLNTGRKEIFDMFSLGLLTGRATGDRKSHKGHSDRAADLHWDEEAGRLYEVEVCELVKLHKRMQHLDVEVIPGGEEDTQSYIISFLYFTRRTLNSNHQV